MAVEVRFPCGHKIAVALVDADRRVVCPFCTADKLQRPTDDVGPKSHGFHIINGELIFYD